MEPEQLIARLKASKIKHEEIADALGRSRTVALQIIHGRRPLKAHEIGPLVKLLGQHDSGDNEENERYVPVEVLPTYAGMGGGGNGDGDRETALVPRALVEDVLRGRPFDFLLVNVRGDSMAPLFQHGDQLLVDRRDRDLARGGPFALRLGESYHIKHAELSYRGLRVFSENPRFADEIVAEDELDVIGRPVWFGRML